MKSISFKRTDKSRNAKKKKKKKRVHLLLCLQKVYGE